MKINIFASGGKHTAESALCSMPDVPFSQVRIGRDILANAGKCLIIKFSQDIIDMHGYWTPELNRPSAQLHWNINFSSAVQRNIPFISLFNQDHANCASFALSCTDTDVEFKVSMNQEFARYDFVIKVAVDDNMSGFLFLASFADAYWPEILADYRGFLLKNETIAFPDSAFLPVYCTWYAVHAALTMKYLEDNVKLAAELGFGTFIVDDGWCFDRMKRVTPETLPSWYEDIGDWELSDKKLSGFREHVRKAQKLGIKYLLWVAPFFLGVNSRSFKALENHDSLLTQPHEGSCVFDPADTVLAEESITRLLNVMKDCGLDGLKVDFLDCAMPSIEKSRAKAVSEYIRKLSAGIRSIKPDALIEFRQRYGTPATIKYATQFRAGDVPFDYLENIHRIAQLRILLGDRVPVHADPVFFHEKELPVNISRHMIAAISGVPMFSMDLEKLSRDNYRIVEHWLGFYLEHLDTFRNGHWHVEYEFDHLSYMSVSLMDEHIIFLLHENNFSETVLAFKGKIHVLNMSNSELETDSFRAYDCFGRKLADGEAAPLGGRIEFVNEE